MKPRLLRRTDVRRHCGAAAVEFALVLVFAFLPLLLGILEFGRLFYVVNTMQEVTRRAAREQVVRWVSQAPAIQRDAIFRSGSSGTVTLPGGHEVTNTNVDLRFYGSYADAVAGSNAITYAGSATPADNLAACLHGDDNCIRYVTAMLRTADGRVLYSPMIVFFADLFDVPLPSSTVIMPAEALGLL